MMVYLQNLVVTQQNMMTYSAHAINQIQARLAEKEAKKVAEEDRLNNITLLDRLASVADIGEE